MQDDSALGSTLGSATVSSGAAIEIDGTGLTIAQPITSLIGTGPSGNGALRNLANVNTWSGTITLGSGGATIAADAGSLTLAAMDGTNRTLTVGGAGDTTIAGVIATGSGGLIKNDVGTLTLGGANTYTGVTTVNDGTLAIGSDDALGVAPGSPTAGRLVIGMATLETTGTFTLDANRGVSLTGSATFSVAAGTTVTAAGIIAGTGDLIKVGAGTLGLSGGNTYSGVTTISVGVIRVASDGALGTTAGTTNVATGAAIEIDGAGLVIVEPITSLIGTGIGGTGSLRNLANDNTWSGTLTLGAGGATVASDAGTLTTGDVTATGIDLTVTGAGDTTIGGVIGTTSRCPRQERSRDPHAECGQHVHGCQTINAGIVRLETPRASGRRPPARRSCRARRSRSTARAHDRRADHQPDRAPGSAATAPSATWPTTTPGRAPSTLGAGGEPPSRPMPARSRPPPSVARPGR